MSQQTVPGKLKRRLPLLLIIAVVVAGVALSLYYSTAPQLTLTPHVAKIVITGTLDYSASSILGATTGVEDYISLIRQAESDPTVRAVILVFDSPGGTVSASYDLYTAVKELARKKVVVSYARGTMASGAYMAACPSTRIYASPSALVGSVGVYTSVLTAEGLLDKLGVKVYTIKSGELKDIGSPYRSMSPEELRVMQEIIDEYFELFKSIVLENRGNVSNEVFTGRPYSPQQALKAGLIDGVTTLEEALNKTKELAGLPPDAPVVELTPPKPGLLTLLFGGSSSRLPLSVPSIVYLAMWPPPQYIVLP
ncbi:signal peptide peptidase SppA [Infirmifilum sp. NZ]|uniref:signal peptide peptidase SppA n=1 Tax=Infirmifilum sp. NZ TaxID=2926850 RepID=UPI0027A41D85|nr:signal peptide peptidase SppA [Infirmifilum sp. NZ]UNQ73956.1 signal peptide peptidase SppA [Infirmifilum sp. NZ]